MLSRRSSYRRLQIIWHRACVHMAEVPRCRLAAHPCNTGVQGEDSKRPAAGNIVSSAEAVLLHQRIQKLQDEQLRLAKVGHAGELVRLKMLEMLPEDCHCQML